MAKHSNRSSLYDEVTAKIISDLEDGRVPWVQPWGTDHVNAALGLPRNAGTRRNYSGINILILWGAVIEHHYSCQHWLTVRQGNKLGGSVRKGERGTTVCFADKFIPKDERERAQTDGDDAKAILFLKRFTVFNVDQFQGLPDSAYETAPPLPERELLPAAEALIEATGADFRIGGIRAFYRPSEDFVRSHRRRRFAIRSTSTASAFTNWPTGPVTHPDLIAIFAAGPGAIRVTRARNWLPKWPPPSFAPNSASNPRCAMPTIWEAGSTS